MLLKKVKKKSQRVVCSFCVAKKILPVIFFLVKNFIPLLFTIVMFLSLNIRTGFQCKIIWIEMEFFSHFLTLLWCNLVMEAAGALSCKVFIMLSEKRDGWIGARETDDLQILSRLYYIYFNKCGSLFKKIYEVVRIKSLNQGEFWVNRTWGLCLLSQAEYVANLEFLL